MPPSEDFVSSTAIHDPKAKVQLQKYPIWLCFSGLSNFEWNSCSVANNVTLQQPAYWYCCALALFSLPCLHLRSLFHKKIKNRGRPRQNFRFVLGSRPLFRRISGKCRETQRIFLTFHFEWKVVASAVYKVDGFKVSVWCIDFQRSWIWLPLWIAI